MRPLLMGVLLLGLSACDQSSVYDEINPTLSHSFEPIMVDAAEEVSGTCQSWTLNNDEPLYVSKVRQRNDGAWHHSKRSRARQ